MFKFMQCLIALILSLSDCEYVKLIIRLFGGGLAGLGPGKTTYPLSTNANILTATLRFSRKYVCPYYDISVGVTLACELH